MKGKILCRNLYLHYVLVGYQELCVCFKIKPSLSFTENAERVAGVLDKCVSHVSVRESLSRPLLEDWLVDMERKHLKIRKTFKYICSKIDAKC